MSNRVISSASVRLRELMKASPLTYAEISRGVHVTVNRLHAWSSEKNQRFPNPFLLRDITTALGLGSGPSKYQYVVTGFHTDPLTEYLNTLGKQEVRIALGMLTAVRDAVWVHEGPIPALKEKTPHSESQIVTASTKLKIIAKDNIEMIGKITDQPIYIIRRWLSAKHKAFPNVFQLESICSLLEVSHVEIIGKHKVYNDITSYLNTSDEKTVLLAKEITSILFNQVFEV